MIGVDCSPETTGQWQCPNCGNTVEFTGIDYRGYPGADCDCGAYDGTGPEVCVCEARLTQDLTVGPHGTLEYDAHSGGYDSEIGEYQRINCGSCGALVWAESKEVAGIE